MKTIHLSVIDSHKFRFQRDYADATSIRVDAYHWRTGHAVTIVASNGETLYVSREYQEKRKRAA